MAVSTTLEHHLPDGSGSYHVGETLLRGHQGQVLQTLDHQEKVLRILGEAHRRHINSRFMVQRDPCLLHLSVHMHRKIRDHAGF